MLRQRSLLARASVSHQPAPEPGPDSLLPCRAMVCVTLADLAEEVPELLRKFLLPNLRLADFCACYLTSKALNSLFKEASEEAWRQAARNAGIPAYHPLYARPTVRQYLQEKRCIDHCFASGRVQEQVWTDQEIGSVVSHDLSKVARVVGTCLHIEELKSRAVLWCCDLAADSSVRSWLEELVHEEPEDVNGELFSRPVFCHDDSMLLLQHHDPRSSGPVRDALLVLCDLRSRRVVTTTLSSLVYHRVAEVTPSWAPSLRTFACLHADAGQDDDYNHGYNAWQVVLTCAERSLAGAQGAQTMHKVRYLGDFCWAPDSQVLAGPVADLDTGACLVQITHLATGLVHLPEVPGREHCTFSPCSSRLLVCGQAASGVTVLDLQGLVLWRSAGIGPLSLDHTRHALWGLHMISITGTGGGFMTCGPSSGLPLLAMVSTVPCSVSAWSPDGRHFAAYKWSRDQLGNFVHTVTLLQVSSGQALRCSVQHFVDKLLWSPDGKAVLACHTVLNKIEEVYQHSMLRLCI